MGLLGVLLTVVSPGAIWAEVEPGFHIELETAIWVDVLPDKRRDGAQVRRRQPPSPVRPSEHVLHARYGNPARPEPKWPLVGRTPTIE